jgi:hypothetical protein
VIASLVANQIDGMIEGDLESNDGAVTLTDVPLFPAGTLFQPVSGGVQFADGVASVETSVPEPATRWLLGAGLIGLAGVRFARLATRRPSLGPL